MVKYIFQILSFNSILEPHPFWTSNVRPFCWLYVNAIVVYFYEVTFITKLFLVMDVIKKYRFCWFFRTFMSKYENLFLTEHNFVYFRTSVDLLEYWNTKETDVFNVISVIIVRSFVNNYCTTIKVIKLFYNI